MGPQPRNTFNVAVVGAGLSGLCLAHSLKKSGIDVHVYERDDSAETRGQAYRPDHLKQRVRRDRSLLSSVGGEGLTRLRDRRGTRRPRPGPS